MDVIKPCFGRYLKDHPENQNSFLVTTSDHYTALMPHMEAFRVHNYEPLNLFGVTPSRYPAHSLRDDRLGDYNDTTSDQPETYDVNTYDSFISASSDLGSIVEKEQ